MSESLIEILAFIESLQKGFNQGFFYSPTTIDTADSDKMCIEKEYKDCIASTDCTECSILIIQVSDIELLVTMYAYKP